MVDNLALTILIGVFTGALTFMLGALIWRRRHVPRVLESLPDAVFILDQHEQIRAFNPAGQLLVPDIPVQTGMALLNLLPQGEPLLAEPQGIEIRRIETMIGVDTYEMRSAPLRVSSNQISGRVITVRNISQQLTAEQASLLQERKRQAEMSRIKNSFVRMAAHDLKSPIAVILGYAEMAIDDAAAGNMNNVVLMLQSITNGAQQMDRLIEDLLDLSKLEAGMPLKLTKASLGFLIKEVVANFRLPAEKKHIDLRYDAPEHDAVLMLDHIRISQVINNLVSNAIKYTPDGGSVSAGFEYHPAEDHVCIRVSDTGLGIPPADLPHLFEPFYRIGGRHHNLADGSGLGLGIARAIVEQHHGTIQVESVLDVGTTFTITLPLL